jgi:cyclophilin family peptidyl-prolyl cis-trans isomerase
MKSIVYSFFLILILLGSKDSNSKSNNEIIISDSTATKDSAFIATIHTNMGTIEIELFEKQAPKTVENFVGLAKKGYYNGVIFHRVIDNFMIQSGDPTGTGRGGKSLWGGKFEDEVVDTLVFDKPYLLAMANAGPNTNGSQFFITLVPTTWLNGLHTIFGEVMLGISEILSGMSVVKNIGKVKTDQNDKPLKDVVIEKITIERVSSRELYFRKLYKG